MEKLIDQIIGWGKARNIIGGATMEAQLDKLQEEVDEIKEGVATSNGAEIIDGIGDATVVLIMLASILGVRYEDCVQEAYNTIKNRKGKLVDGVFIKEEDFAKHGIN